MLTGWLLSDGDAFAGRRLTEEIETHCPYKFLFG